MKAFGLFTSANRNLSDFHHCDRFVLNVCCVSNLTLVPIQLIGRNIYKRKEKVFMWKFIFTNTLAQLINFFLKLSVLHVITLQKDRFAISENSARFKTVTLARVITSRKKNTKYNVSFCKCFIALISIEKTL